MNITKEKENLLILRTAKEISNEPEIRKKIIEIYFQIKDVLLRIYFLIIIIVQFFHYYKCYTASSFNPSLKK